MPDSDFASKEGQSITRLSRVPDRDEGREDRPSEGLAESARLQRQADELAEESEALLSRVELHAGDAAIDLGCGPRGVLDLLIGLVGPTGHVIGLDIDPEHVALASKFVGERGWDNVELVCGDASDTHRPAESFHLVHSRTLLINVSEPESVLSEMVRLVRPGGWVAGLEPDTGGAFCYPTTLAVDRLYDVFTRAFVASGGDPYFGRRMPELYRKAGLTDVGFEIRAEPYPLGHSRRTLWVDVLRTQHAAVAELGMASLDELHELDGAVREHLSNADVLVMPSLHVLAWGRKPLVG